MGSASLLQLWPPRLSLSSNMGSPAVSCRLSASLTERALCSLPRHTSNLWMQPQTENSLRRPINVRRLWGRHLCKGRRKAVGPDALPISAALSRQERLREAARQVVDSFVRNYSVIGLGTGPASAMVIAIIGSKLRDGTLKEIQGVPMSRWSAAEATKAGIPLTQFDGKRKLEMAFDDVDQIQEGTLFAIVGRPGVSGRESIVQEKAIAGAAKEFVLIADEAEFVENLIGELPVLIQQEDWLETAEEIDDLFLGDAEVWRRPTVGEAGPMGGDFPLVTQEGHFVLDVLFTSAIEDAEEVARSLESIPGVMGHGLFLDVASAAVIGTKDGVKIRTSLFRKAFTKKS